MVLAVLTNDIDAPDVREILSITAINGLTCTDGRDSSVSPSLATAIIASPTSGIQFSTIQYFWGTCAFDYTISDGNGGSSTSSVTVTVHNGIISITYLLYSY